MTNEKSINLRTKKFKDDVLDSFFELINIKEFSKISISDVCRGADVSRQGFYLYYKSIDDMLVKELLSRFEYSLLVIKDEKDFPEIIRRTYNYAFENKDKICRFFDKKISHITKPAFKKIFDEFSLNFFWHANGVVESKYFKYDFAIRNSIFFSVFENLFDYDFDLTADDVINLLIPYYKVGDYSEVAKVHF